MQQLFIDHYGITAEGNWEEGKNIPDVNYGKNKLTVNEQITSETYFTQAKNYLLKEKKESDPAQMTKF